MTQEEIEAKLKEQEVEEREKTTFSKEQLELVVSQFALLVLKENPRLTITPSCFKFLLEEYQLGTMFMKSGNPVEIHIRLQDLADALVLKGKHLYDFKRIVESAIRAVPKMLHTLAVVPTRDIAAWKADIQKFKWHAGNDTDFLPKLLPDSEIHYDIQLRIIATHIKTDTRVVVNDRQMDLVKLRRTAREILSEEVHCLTPEPEEVIEMIPQDENIMRQIYG